MESVFINAITAEFGDYWRCKLRHKRDRNGLHITVQFVCASTQGDTLHADCA